MLDDVRPASPDDALPFPIVGIGASAGGLAAFEAFFTAMSALGDTGMGFVLVQHLAPDHKSLLVSLIRQHTRMPVVEVEDGMKVRPNCAYIIPPNRDMALLNGTLQLFEPVAPRGHRLPIDFFFTSLAQDRRDRAVCVVLSGNGRDGSLGVRAIKEAGGLVMVQAPASTEHASMPEAAIATGLADFVLPPAELPARLAAYGSHAFGPARGPPLGESLDDAALARIFALLTAHTRHDFSKYKRNTIARRIARRMAVHQLDQLDAYVRHLEQAPDEIDALFRDLLIGVTSFFRDPPAFAALAAHLEPRLQALEASGATFRVWIPGTSTGEEAYSIAILLHEACDTVGCAPKLQIFATDIDTRAIDQARRGVYPSSITAEVSPERLARFFVAGPDGSGYRVRKSVRDSLVFSEQDVLREPPFSRLDLVSCRNLLIYLGTELQKRLIPLFHYALRPGGLLLLGSSETVGQHVDLFTLLDGPSKLYQRQEDLRRRPQPNLGALLPALVEPRPRAPRPADPRSRLRELTETALLQEYGAVAALVDTRGDVLYLHGRTGAYLEPPPGDASVNILKMARDGLREVLGTALHAVAAHKRAVRRPGLQIVGSGEAVHVDLTVRPVFTGPDSTLTSSVFAVIFERAGAPVGSEPTPPAAVSDEPTHLESLRVELRAKEDFLRAANDDLEVSNEELKSANEEMQSINEELQSTNEELETSKEELHAVNEELSTVNAELQQRLVELSRLNDDMNNLLAGTGIGTIFVDRELRIQRFTPAAALVVNLIAGDVGRPLAHVVSNLRSYDQLVEDTAQVLRDLVPKDVTAQTHAGAWYSIRLRPYRTLAGAIEGAVVSFFDITALRVPEGP